MIHYITITKLCQTAGCDLVGFHIDDYALNFLDCCQRCLGCLTDKNTMYRIRSHISYSFYL